MIDRKRESLRAFLQGQFATWLAHDARGSGAKPTRDELALARQAADSALDVLAPPEVQLRLEPEVVIGQNVVSVDPTTGAGTFHGVKWP